MSMQQEAEKQCREPSALHDKGQSAPTRARREPHSPPEDEASACERLQRELELRNCAMDAAASHFMILDTQRPHWPIVYVNRAILRDYGYTPDEVLNHSAAEFIDVENSAVQIEQMNEAMSRGEEARTE